MAPSLSAFFYVGLGGLIGALMRFSATLVAARFSLSFPWGTLVSNLAGCFMIGAIMTLAIDSDLLSPELRLFLATGICGGFTTMSSFVYELAQFVQDKEVFLGSLYLVGTLAGAALCFYLGSWLASGLLRT